MNTSTRLRNAAENAGKKSKAYSFWRVVDTCLVMSIEAMVGFKIRSDEEKAAKAEAIVNELIRNLKIISAPMPVFTVQAATEQAEALGRIVGVVKGFAETFESQSESHRLHGPNNDAFEYVWAKYLDPDKPMVGFKLLEAQREGGLAGAMADILMHDTGHFAKSLNTLMTEGKINSGDLSVAGYQQHVRENYAHLGRIGRVGLLHMGWNAATNALTGALMDLSPMTAGLAKMVPSLTAAAPHVMISMLAGIGIALTMSAMMKPTPTRVTDVKAFRPVN